MGKPAPSIKKKEEIFHEEEVPLEDLWPETDGHIEDLLDDVSPNIMSREKMDVMVREMREFMLGQFEQRGVATRDQIYSFMEEMDEEDEDLDSLNINIE